MPIGTSDKYVNSIVRAGGADVLELDEAGGGNAFWWLVFDGREFGPLSTSAVSQLCLSGVVRQDTPVRSSRFTQHVPASTLRALRTLFSPTAADALAVADALRAIPSAPLKVHLPQFAPLSLRAKRRAAVLVLCVGAAVLLVMMCLPLLKRQRDADARDARAAVQTRDAAEENAFASDLRARIDGASGAPKATSTAGAPAPPRELAGSPNDTDELRLKRVVRWSVLASVDAYMRYDQSIRALNLNDVWKPDRLADAATYPEARRRCDAVREALKKLGEELEQAQVGVAERARASGAAPPAQEVFMAEYAIHRNDERAAYRAFAAEEKKLLVEIEGLLGFLEDRARGGAVTSRGGRILFRERGDLDEFRSRAQRLSAVATQRTQQTAQNRQQLLKTIDRNGAADAR